MYTFLCFMIFLLSIAVLYYKKLSEKDAFTGCYNKEWFMIRKNSKLLRMMMEVVQGNSSQFGLLFIDMDGFKEVNDNRGHPYGDEVILRTVKAIKDKIRNDYFRDGVYQGKDFIVRFGGDELIVVLKNVCDLKELYGIAESIRLNVKTATKHTVSIGGVLYNAQRSINVNSFIKDVDKKLYNAKAQGRDKVCV